MPLGRLGGRSEITQVPISTHSSGSSLSPSRILTSTLTWFSMAVPKTLVTSAGSEVCSRIMIRLRREPSRAMVTMPSEWLLTLLTTTPPRRPTTSSGTASSTAWVTVWIVAASSSLAVPFSTFSWSCLAARIMRIAAQYAAPTATHSSGLTPFSLFLPVTRSSISLTAGIRVEPPTGMMQSRSSQVRFAFLSTTSM